MDFVTQLLISFLGADMAFITVALEVIDRKEEVKP